MLDALDLANRLTSDAFPDVASALASYEATKLGRMIPAIEETLAAQYLMIAPDAPAGILDLIAHRTQAH
jgi:hypothetical protein